MAPGPCPVQSRRFDWTDAKRDRPVPVKIYFPGNEDKSLPIVIFSHGMGGSRESYDFLGRHWASHGYVSVHVQHEGSDDAVWRDRKRTSGRVNRAAKDPDNAVNRPLDISFAIDQLETLQTQDGPLKGRLALDRIAVAGHAFGAMTALMLAGEAGSRSSEKHSLVDARVKAAIYMSPPVPVYRGRFEEVYAGIRIPGLHLVGTLDESRNTRTKSDDRRIPYDNIDKADQYLVTLNGADRDVFSGRVRPGPGSDNEAQGQDLVRMSTTAFLDAYLKQDDEAQTWLRDGGLKAALGKRGVFEQKHVAAQAVQ
jgi:predicted dienelactone hydrolase